MTTSIRSVSQYCSPHMEAVPLKCPHEDCRYRDGLVDGKLGFWLAMNSEDAIAMVDAVENNHPHRLVLLVKAQPWFAGMAAQLASYSQP